MPTLLLSNIFLLRQIGDVVVFGVSMNGIAKLTNGNGNVAFVYHFHSIVVHTFDYVPESLCAIFARYSRLSMGYSDRVDWNMKFILEFEFRA